MSAETLRQAAALMRERATASLRDGSEARDLWLAGPMVDPDNNGWYVCHRQQKDVDWDTTVAVLEYDFHGSTAKHIASWHPAVALAVADWLDHESVTWEDNERVWTAGASDPRNRWEERGLTVEGNLAHSHRHALAVAHAYLGTEATA